LDTFREGLELLFTRTTNRVTKDQLSNQFPALGGLPFSLDQTINQGGIMLQIAAQAFTFKSSPAGELDHTVRLFRPDGEVMSIQGELFLLGLDVILVFEEQNGTVTTGETVHLGVGGAELVSRDDLSQDFSGAFPKLVVFFTEEDLGSAGLNIKRAGNVQDVVFNDFNDSLFRNGDVLVKTVDGSSLLDGVEEGVSVGGVVEGLSGHGGVNRLGEVLLKVVSKSREHVAKGYLII
jgi:hypothetical protein